MIKKILFICLVIILCVVGYKNFSFQKNDKNIVVLQFSSWGSESEIRILKPILEEFEKENPDIKIDFMHIPQNYFQKIHLLFASNTPPDVIFLNNQYLPVYANAGLLEDLSEYKQEFEYEKFFPKSLEAMMWENIIYAVPRDVSTLVIYYNKEIFNKYGIPYPNKNWNFGEFLNTAKALTHRPETFGISFDETPLLYLPYITSDGYSGVPYFESIKDTSGLKFYTDLRTKYHVAPMRYESASATMAQMFLQGKLAMHLSGRWLVPIYRSDAKFDWDIAEFPAGSAGSIVPLDASGWAVSKASKHKNEAVRFVKYLSSKNSIDKFTQGGLIVPARTDCAYSKVFLDGKKPKNAKVFLDTAENSVPTKVTVDYRVILDDLKTKTEVLFNPPEK